MKFRLVTNDYDTLIGMRLAGIEGEIAQQPQEVLSALDRLSCQKDVGIIMLSNSLASSIPKQLVEIKKNSKALIVEIPDKDNSDMSSDSITRYVADAIGIKI